MPKEKKLISTITRSRLRLLYPEVAIRAIRVFNDFYTETGLLLNCAQGLRTYARQEKLYASGRTKPGAIVTQARGGYSFHNYGLALDVSFRGRDPYLDKFEESRRNDLWKLFGKVAKTHGFIWGGDFNGISDRPHIHLTFGFTVYELLEVYQDYKLPGIWTMLDRHRKVPSGTDWLHPFDKGVNIELIKNKIV